MLLPAATILLLVLRPEPRLYKAGGRGRLLGPGVNRAAELCWVPLPPDVASVETTAAIDVGVEGTATAEARTALDVPLVVGGWPPPVDDEAKNGFCRSSASSTLTITADPTSTLLKFTKLSATVSAAFKDKNEGGCIGDKSEVLHLNLKFNFKGHRKKLYRTSFEN